jgi:exosome complex component RRP46
MRVLSLNHLGTESKSLAATIRTLLAPSLVLTQNPRTLVQLVVQSLTPAAPKPDPSLTAAFINASSLALLRASSFAMLGVVCAAAVGRVKDSQVDGDAVSRTLLLDPTEQELQRCDATGCVAIMFRAARSSGARKGLERMDEDADEKEGEIVWSSFQGAPLQSDYDALLRLAKSGARAVYRVMRERLREELEGAGADAERCAKKMPKHKGCRVALNVGTEDAMDTT